MDLSGPLGAFISAAIVAYLGTWWFAYVLKGLQSLKPVQRNIVYAAIWGAYFLLTWILITKLEA